MIDDLGYESPEESNENYLLTNAHVTQDDVSNPIKDIDIVQPGMTSFYIGQVVDTEPINPSAENEIDASLIVLDEDAEFKMVNGAVPDGYGEAEVGEKVIKYGRTTRLSSGTLQQKNVTVAINYGGRCYHRR